MIRIRQSSERGLTRLPWLEGRHSFSFNRYYDPQWMGFRSLRVINEDTIRPGGGFGTHPHDNMEILTYVTRGGLRHADSLGTSAVIPAGEFQRMTAGTGIAHSEFNDSQTDPVHLFQIWIEPEQMGLEPGYEQRRFSAEESAGELRLVAAPKDGNGTLTIHQNAKVYLGSLHAGQKTEHVLDAGRGAWLQVIAGSVQLNGQSLRTGDGAAVEDEPKLVIQANDEAQVMLFDLA